MNHGHPARRARPGHVDNLREKARNSSLLMPHEIEQALYLVRPSLVALRQGVATKLQWSTLYTAINIALVIEDLRLVKGLREHLATAELALLEISKRATIAGEWRNVELQLQELDDVAEAILLFEFQLAQLSMSQLARAITAAGVRVYQADILPVKFEMPQGALP